MKWCKHELFGDIKKYCLLEGEAVCVGEMKQDLKINLCIMLRSLDLVCGLIVESSAYWHARK